MICLPQFRALGVLGAATLAYGCAAGGRSNTASPALAVSFSATSLHSIYGIQGRLEGTVTVGGGWLDVVVSSGAMRGFQGDVQHYADLRVRAAVATCTNGGHWDVRSESRAVMLAPVFGIGTRSAAADTAMRTMRDTLRFAVAVPRGTSLERSWLAFVFEWPFENAFATYTMNTDVALSGRGAPRATC